MSVRVRVRALCAHKAARQVRKGRRALASPHEEKRPRRHPPPARPGPTARLRPCDRAREAYVGQGHMRATKATAAQATARARGRTGFPSEKTQISTLVH